MLPLKKNHKQQLSRLALSALALVLGLIFWARAYHTALDLYLTPSELHGPTAQNIRLGGHIVPGSISFTPSGGVAFIISDTQSQIPVIYAGAPPSLFQEGIETIALGHFDGYTFTAAELFVKHDQNYRTKKEPPCF